MTTNKEMGREEMIAYLNKRSKKDLVAISLGAVIRASVLEKVVLTLRMSELLPDELKEEIDRLLKTMKG